MDKQRVLEVYTIRQYGRDLIYPVDSQTAELVMDLVETKTLNMHQIRILEKLGITVKQVLAPSQQLFITHTDNE